MSRMIRVAFTLRRVVGESMLPLLRPDQIVLVRHTRRIRPGDVVLLRHQGIEKIKRVTQIRSGSIYVVGDNKRASTDSRDFGWLPLDSVRGKVVLPRTHVPAN